MKLLRIAQLTLIILFFSSRVQSQQYHATHGSAYAGAVSIFNNPASSVNSIYKWDLNVFSVQSTITTNNLSLANFSYSNPGNTTLSIKDGSNSYYAHQNLDLNLLNFQYKLDEKHAFTVAFRGRMYNHGKSAPVYGNDTISSLNSFLKINRNTPFYEGFATHAGWLEMNLNYAQVLYETGTGSLSAGISLNISKGISGFYGKLYRSSVVENIVGRDTGYTLTNGGLEYAYSNNYDDLNSVNNSGIKNFLKNSRTSLGISLGVEYTIYKETASDENQHNPANYSWKLGLSLMDLGKNSYAPSTFSSRFLDPAPNITDAAFSNKFTNVTTINDFNDSLKTIFTKTDSLSNNFTISKPTRLIFNVDKNLGNNFAVNGQLNINFFSTSNYNKLLTRELNMLTITPRWETMSWGFYLPIQYTTQGQLWVGTAIKLGPLTIGLHNISWVKKITTINGGGYMLLSIHPFNRKKSLSRFDCPQ